MDLFNFYLLLITFTASLLILMYSAILWKNWKGSKFKFIYLIVGILLLGNIALLTFVLADYKLFLMEEFKPVYVWMLSLGNGVSDLALCVSHVLLAFKYRQVAREKPLEIEMTQMPKN